MLATLGGLAAFGMGFGARALYESRGNDTRGGAVVASVTPGSASAPADAAVVDAAVAPARIEHAVFDFVDNRHAAHVFRDSEPVLDASHVGFARYTRFGVPVVRWQLGQTVAGTRAAVAERLASLEVPLSGGHATWVTEVTARVHGAAKQKLAFKINGRAVADRARDARVELVDGWQTIRVAIAPGRLVDGENQVAIETTGTNGKVAFEWLRFGPTREDTDDPRAVVKFDGGAHTISLASNSSLVWYLTVPEGGHLVAGVAAPCKVEVHARTSDGSSLGGLLDADTNRVDMTPMAGRVVALAITARQCPRATIAVPRITVHGPAPELRARTAAPKYIVLWVMDALRADKIPIFTPGARAQTPNFDELAKSSAVFRQYYVQGNESQTSHSSVWTGLYPAVHGVRLAGVGGTYKIAPTFDVLAQELAEAGMYTAAVTGNGFVNDSGGYTRGFAEFRNMMRERGVTNGVIYGDKIVDAALARFDANRDRPTYLFFGTIDTHAPWIARKPWIDIYSPGPYNGPFKHYGTAKDLGFRPGSMGCAIIPPPADVERLRAIYDSAISYQDRELGRFIAQLKSWGIWDQTMLVITADHGEELFEDRRCGHGGSLRESLVRVPLLIYDPARFPGGTIVHEGAEGVDIMPTMLDAVGAPAVPAAQGASLIPVAQGIGRGWATPSYASQYEYAHAMRIGRWKLRISARGVPIVSDLVKDPDEQLDVSRTAPVERRMLSDNLGLFLALRTQWKKSAWGVTTNVTPAGAAALDAASTP